MDIIEYSDECLMKIRAIKTVKRLIDKWYELNRVDYMKISIEIKIYENYINAFYDLLKAELSCLEDKSPKNFRY